MCFAWIWEQTAIKSLYSINLLIFIAETESVFYAVRTECLYNTFKNSGYILQQGWRTKVSVPSMTPSDISAGTAWLQILPTLRSEAS